LLEQNTQLLQHTMRMGRVEKGLHEVPRELRPPMEPMPLELMAYIKSFAFPQFRRMQYQEAYKKHARGESWASIMQSVMKTKQTQEIEDEHDPEDQGE
jgi:hypothetical protein